MSRLEDIELEELYEKYKATRSPKDYLAVLLYDELRSDYPRLFPVTGGCCVWYASPILRKIKDAANQKIGDFCCCKTELEIINGILDDVIGESKNEDETLYKKDMYYISYLRKRINEKFEEMM